MYEFLLPETREIIGHVRSTTGRDILLMEDSNPNYSGRWYLEYETRPSASEPHHIGYNPDSRFVNHLVAHECGHILRFYRVPLSERLVLVGTKENRIKAATRTDEDLIASGKNWKDSLIVARTFDLLYEGLMQQLESIPPDIFIERWLYSEYPDLRDEQTKSVKKTVHNSYKVLKPCVKRATPKTIYNASTSMNYAFARSMGELFGNGHFIRPYWKTPARRLGETLLESLGEDEGYSSDRKAIDKWAELLGLEGWYEWRPIMDVRPKTVEVSIIEK